MTCSRTLTRPFADLLSFSLLSVRFNTLFRAFFLLLYSVFNEQFRTFSASRTVGPDAQAIKLSHPYLVGPDAQAIKLSHPYLVGLDARVMLRRTAVLPASRNALSRILTWSVWMDSDHRPRAYQARALAT